MAMLPIGRFRIPCTCAAALAMLVTHAQAAAQSVPTRTLSRPDARYAEPFTNVIGIRELRDGRVIVGDSHERTVQLIDLRRGTARVLGREGAGPEEYAIPSRLIPLAGDTTLLYDSGNGRFLIILGDGRIAGTMLPETSSGSPLPGSPTGWDANRFYYRMNLYPPGERRMDDTPVRAAITRFDRRSRAIDTVATLAIPAGRSQGARQLEGGMLQMLDNRPLAAEDVAAVAPDGRVAIVRAAPYRVEWIQRDGRRVTGPEVRYQPRRVTDEDKRAFLRRQIRPGSIVVRRQAGGDEGRAMPIARSGLPRPRDETDIDDPALTWPTHMPPFLSGAARVAPDGTLWVLRTRPHDDPIPTYDLFDASGSLTGRVALPPDTRLLGFGNGTIYLIRVDEDDLQWIERYRL